jgi:hypothetical protein
MGWKTWSKLTTFRYLSISASLLRIPLGYWVARCLVRCGGLGPGVVQHTLLAKE